MSLPYCQENSRRNLPRSKSGLRTGAGRPVNTNPRNFAAPNNNYLSDNQSANSGVPNSPQYQGVIPLNILPQGSKAGVEHNPYTDPLNPDRTTAPQLSRDRRLVEYVGYAITPLLHVGHNQIKIALYKDQPVTNSLSRKPFFAFDGGYTSGDHGPVLLAANKPGFWSPILRGTKS